MNTDDKNRASYTTIYCPICKKSCDIHDNKDCNMRFSLMWYHVDKVCLNPQCKWVNMTIGINAHYCSQCGTELTEIKK